MRVLVTGATGFVGAHVCRRLSSEGWEVRGLSRSAPAGREAGVQWVRGDVVTGEGLHAALDGVQAVAHLVGIIREGRRRTFEDVHVRGTRNLLAAAQEAGAPRFVHFSALGADPDSASRYLRSKGEAEGSVRASGLPWTVLRPSLIFGPGDGFFGGSLRRLVTVPPVVPVVGRGEYRFRPVWVEDVALGLARALERPAASGRSLDLVGPREYTLRELLELERDHLRPRKPLVNVPVHLVRLGVQLFRALPDPPVTPDEFRMLLAGNTADPGPAAEALGLEPAALEDHLAEVLGPGRGYGRR